MDIKIRAAVPSDAENILNLIKGTQELQGLGDADPVYSESFVNDFITDKKMNLALVAEASGAFAGFLFAEIWQGKKYSFLDNFAIKQEFRAKGIGSQLYDEFEGICRKKGLRTAIALVEQSNTAMQEFFKKKEYEKGHKLFFYEKVFK